MQVFLCGVFTGPFNGQMQTLFGVRDALNKKFNLRIIYYPFKGLLFPFKWFYFLVNLLFCVFCNKKPRLFYLSLNRSRLGFWFRDFPVFFIAGVTNSKIICHLVGSDIGDFISSLNRIEIFILKYYFKKINTWVVLGKAMESQVANIYKDLNIHESSKCFKNKNFNSLIVRGFFPNEANSFVNNNSNVSKKSFNYPINIGYMSNLIEEKGVVEFIESIIYLKEEHNIDIKAWIAGVYIEKPSLRLKESIENAQQKEYIDMLGLIMGDDKWMKLVDTDIFILPTYYRSESLPLALVEAMKANCYCISSSVGEIKDLLGDDRGLIIDNISSHSISEGVKFALSDINDFKSKTHNASRYVGKEFAFNNFQTKIVNLVNSFKL